MKLKKEYVILLLVIAALTAYLFLRSGDQTYFEMPRLDTVESDQINRLVITKGQRTVALQKEDEQWVVGPKAYAGDGIKVKNMVRAAADLTLTALVSESRSYERYGLDDAQRIHVEVSAGKKKVRDFFIGRRAPTHQHTFVALAGNPDVYHARGSIDTTYDRTIDELRDLTVLNYEKGDISAVILNRGDQTATFIRKIKTPEEEAASEAGQESESPEPEFQWVDTDDNPVATADVDRIITQFSNLKCDNYLEDDAKEGLKAPLWTVTLKSDQKAAHLSLYDKEDKKSTRFPAVSSGSPYAFILQKSRVETFEKSIAKLLKEKSPEPDKHSPKES
jgi:hypothetical protein